MALVGGRGDRRPHPRLPRAQIPRRSGPAPARDPPRADHARSLRARAGRPARRAPVARPRPLGRASSARNADSSGRAAARLPLPPRRGREPAPDTGRPGPRRHHRARAFPLHRQWRDRRPAGGAARLRPQGHRRPDGRSRASTGRRSSPAAPRAIRPSPMPSPSPAPPKRRPGSTRRRARSSSAR